MTDRGQFADPEKKSLLAAASKVVALTPAIGTEIHGLDLRQLTDAQKDELCVLPRPSGSARGQRADRLRFTGHC